MASPEARRRQALVRIQREAPREDAHLLLLFVVVAALLILAAVLVAVRG